MFGHEENQGNIAQVNPQSKTGFSRLLIIAVVVTLVIVVSVLGFTFFASNDQVSDDGFVSDGQNDEMVWYFPGAYANYEGSTSYLFVTVDFSMHFEVVDFNKTHVKTFYDMKLDSDWLGTLFSENDTAWAPIENIGTFAWNEMGGYVSGGEYEERVYIEGFGTRLCKIYELSQTGPDSNNLVITVYADPEIELPIKLSLALPVDDGQNIVLDSNLKDTNIKELL